MPTKTGSGIVHNGLAMNFDANEHRSSYGPNLLSKHIYENNQNVTIDKSPDASLKVTCNQSTSTPGVWPLGTTSSTPGDIPVYNGRQYIFRTYAKYNGPGGNAYNYVYSLNNGNLVWTGDAIDSQEYEWHENTFDITSDTSIRPGILWSVASNTASLNVKEWRLHDLHRWWDSTGNSAGCLRYGGVTYTNKTVNLNGTVTAGYYSLDGVNDHFQDQYNEASKIAYPTSEVWFRPQGEPGGSYHSIFQKDGGYSGGAVYGMRATSGTSPYAYTSIWYSSTTGDLISVSAPQRPMEWGYWYHLVATYDGTNLNLYVNGEFVNGVSTGAGRPAYQPNGYFKIGTGDSRYANGDIGAVRVYNRPLTAKEVKQNFNAVKAMYGYGV